MLSEKENSDVNIFCLVVPIEQFFLKDDTETDLIMKGIASKNSTGGIDISMISS